METAGIIRTPEVIAAEINGIKQQVRGTVLSAAVEIGRRLTEAKALVPHGDWADWLQTHVDYSQRTAQNMMALAGEYRDGQGPQSLSYTKAVLLLGVPRAEREEFAAAHDLDAMSTRELKEAVAALTQKNAEMQISMDELIAGRADPGPEDDPAQEMQAEMERLRAEADRAKAGVEAAREIKRSDEADKKALRARLKEMEARDVEAKGRAAEAQRAAEAEIARLKAALDTAAQPIIQQAAPPEMEAELTRLRAQAQRSDRESALRLAWEGMQDTYERLEHLLSDLGTEDTEKAGKYRAAMGRGLAMMAKQIGGGADA